MRATISRQRRFKAIWRRNETLRMELTDYHRDFRTATNQTPHDSAPSRTGNRFRELRRSLRVQPRALLLIRQSRRRVKHGLSPMSQCSECRRPRDPAVIKRIAMDHLSVRVEAVWQIRWSVDTLRIPECHPASDAWRMVCLITDYPALHLNFRELRITIIPSKIAK